jgi:hypothetical protein
MSDIAELKQIVPTQDQIERLRMEMIQHQQVELPTEHYFADGMYCRKLTRPAGTLIVGKVHKKDHFFICAAGEIIAWTENGMRHLMPGDVVESKPGTKRVTFAVTDAVGITVHKTDKIDIDEIEEELVEFDELSMFNPGNKLKSDQEIQAILEKIKTEVIK